ncbi:hypothetical protein F2P79_005368 [Pimephales promelas]|nr:hypothetical protein F2P79_005368 [Pimephales promelas]
MRELHVSLCVSGSMLESICYAGSFQATSVRSQEQTLILHGYLIKGIQAYCSAASSLCCSKPLWNDSDITKNKISVSPWKTRE